MSKILEFKKEEVQDVSEVVKKQFNTDKYVIGVMNDDNCITYISNNIGDMELCYLIDTLRQRRDNEF